MKIAVVGTALVTFITGVLTITGACGALVKGLGYSGVPSDYTRKNVLGSVPLRFGDAPTWQSDDSIIILNHRLAQPPDLKVFPSFFSASSDAARVGGDSAVITFSLKSQRKQEVTITGVSAVDVRKIATPKGTMLWMPPGGGGGEIIDLGLKFDRLPPSVSAHRLAYEGGMSPTKDLGVYPGHGKRYTTLKDQQNIFFNIYVDTLHVAAEFKLAIAYQLGGRPQKPVIVGNNGDSHRRFRVTPLCSGSKYAKVANRFTIDLGFTATTKAVAMKKEHLPKDCIKKSEDGN
jgi:hypothetical protein